MQLHLPWFPPLPPRLYAGLHPCGTWNKPCVVVCNVCGYEETAPTCSAGQVLAYWHDVDHHS